MSTNSFPGDTELIKPLLLGVSAIAIIIVAYFSNDGGSGATKKKKVSIVTSSSTTATTTASSKKGASKKKKPVTTTTATSSKSPPPPVATASPPPPPKVEKKVTTVVEKKVVVIQEPKPELESSEQLLADESKKAKKKKPKKKAGNAIASSPSLVLKPSSFTNGSTGGGTKEENDDSDEDEDDVELWRISSAAASKKAGAIDAAKRAASNKERDRIRALRRAEEKARAEARAIEEEEAAKVALEAEKKAALNEAKKRVLEEAKLAMKKDDSSSNGAATSIGNGSTTNGGSSNKTVANNAAKAAPITNGTAAVAAAVDPPAEKKKRKRSKKKGAGAAVPESRPALVKPAPSVEIWEVVPVVEEWQEVGTKKAKGKTDVVAPVSTTPVPSSIQPGGDAAAGVGAEESPPAPLDVEETSVTLPTGDDPLIFIGKGGATIQKLQESTGAKFHLNRGTNMLTISGLENAVQLGLAAARSILAAEAEKKASEVEESVTWGFDAIKAVIGRGGANIRATQEATGTRIDADVDSGTLVIVGSADQVAIALTMCKNAAFGEVNEVIELCSRNAVNLIFGQNFQTIRSLQDSTGCKLDIARGSTTLKLSGSSDAVAKAKANIHALLDTNRGFEMTIEVSKVGAVYGKGGETLRSIENKTGTQIDVVRGPTHATISVMGTAEASGRARNMLQRAIDGDVELKPGEVAEEISLGLATAAVIGRGGSNVALLEKKHGVKVNVRSELQKARVVGKPNNVAEAVKEIDAIVKPIMKRAEDQKKVDDAVKAGDSEWQIKSQQADDAEGW